MSDQKYMVLAGYRDEDGIVQEDSLSLEDATAFVEKCVAGKRLDYTKFDDFTWFNGPGYWFKIKAQS